MPALASKGVNHQLYNSVEQRENKKISLDVSNSEENIKNTWTLFNAVIGDESASVVEISEKSRMCNLTADKIKAISLKMLKSFDISEYSYDDFKAVANLFISIGDETVEQTNVYWKCTWSDKNNIQQVMWIDDLSGKMVGLIIKHDEISTKAGNQTEQEIGGYDTDIPDEVIALSEYCKENYQADDVVCHKGFRDYYIIEMIINKNGDNFIYPISVYCKAGEYLLFNVR